MPTREFTVLEFDAWQAACGDTPAHYIDLIEVLNIFGEHGAARTWRLRSFDGVTRAGAWLNYDEINLKIDADPAGWQLSWHDLLRVCDGIHQTIWCSLHSDHDVVIEAQDSTYWLIATTSSDLVHRVTRDFPNVRPGDFDLLEVSVARITADDEP